MNRAQTLDSVEKEFSGDMSYLHEWDLDKGNLPISKIARPDSGMLLDFQRYVNLLEESDFFLAAPGGTFPIAHNLAEAMLSGSIPILSYSDYPIPALTAGENCLSYSTQEELFDVLRIAMAMSDQEVIRMREKVLGYAREHLKIGLFSGAYRSEEKQSLSLKLFYFHEFLGDKK